MGTLSASNANSGLLQGGWVSLMVFGLTTLLVFLCAKESYRQIDLAHEMEAALTTSDEACTLMTGKAHAALSAISSTEDHIWCDPSDGSCALWTEGKVVDTGCALRSLRNKN